MSQDVEEEQASASTAEAPAESSGVQADHDVHNQFAVKNFSTDMPRDPYQVLHVCVRAV